jgi:hypothetical protein
MSPRLVWKALQTLQRNAEIAGQLPACGLPVPPKGGIQDVRVGVRRLNSP